MTPEQKEQIFSLRSKNSSLTQIAVAVGATRSAVAGLLARRFSTKIYVRRPKHVEAAKPVEPEALPDAAKPKYRPYVSKPVDAPADAIVLADLDAHSCRWPFGTEDFQFCGHEIMSGEVYCEAHCKLAYTAARPAPFRRS